MNFSLILASRDRLPLLRSLLDSLCEMTLHPSEIEVVVIFDEDDMPSKLAMPNLSSRYANINAKFFTRERSEWMHRDYINWAVPKSSGKYVIVLNDDTKFVNEGWDEQAWERLEQYLSDKPDGVVYGFTDTFSKDSNLCCFPLISRKAIDALGFMLPDERKNWSADHDIYAIYTHPLVNRKFNVPEIKIQHVAFHSGLRERDAVSYRIEQIFHREPRVDIPVPFYADVLASYMHRSGVAQNAKVLVVYNICGISKRENVDYYCAAINSILNQKFDSFRVVISGCLTQLMTKRRLVKNFGNRISYNWIDEKLPLSLTFNHSVQKCVDEFGDFDAYLYVDSGVTFGNDRQVIQKLYDALKDSVAMSSAQVDSDSGYEYWGIHVSQNEDYTMPIGKTANLHCQMFSRILFEKYNRRILPDIFAHHTSESVYTFLNAGINCKWVICHNLKVHHESNMDGASSGFIRNHGLLFQSTKTIEQICDQGRQYGFGYEEYRRICVHDHSKFDKDGYALDDRLYPFCRDNLYLNHFDFNGVNHHFTPESTRTYAELPSPHITCLICSHNKPGFVNDAIRSILEQDYDDWQAIIIDSGVLMDSGHFNWIDDSRVSVVRSGETEVTRRTKAMAPWCFNECFRRGLVKGSLIVYLCDDDIFYTNAFGVFADHKRKNMHVHAMYASQDCAVISADGTIVMAGERRAREDRGSCGLPLDCRVDYLQLCHTREMLEWLPNKPEYWGEGKITESHADGVFMESIGAIVPIHPIDVKIGQNRRTPISTYVPST